MKYFNHNTWLRWAMVLLAVPGVSLPLDQLTLPPRPAGSMTGTQFKDLILNLPRAEREVTIYREIAKGNVAPFLRTLKPVTITATIDSQLRTGIYYVTPDYVAIGTDADYFLMPMTPILAQWVADLTQTILPTRKMVGATWTVATCKLAPSPIPPSAEMVTVQVFWDHNGTVKGQRAGNAAPLGALVGGNKKDVVISPQVVSYPSPKRVAIYGWHQLNGSPIQPLYFGHENTYADYSHGIRLANHKMLLDGTTVTVADVLTSTAVHTLLNDESVFTVSAPPRYNVPPPPGTFPYVDSFPSTGRQLGGWIDRFQTHMVAAFSPTAPGGDGFVVTVKDTSGGIDTSRIGDSTDTDYYVEAAIYCDYRPGLASDGFERVGVFARDDGNGLFCGQNGAGTIKGNNYALTWDSHNGRIQCLRTVAGIPTDMLPSQVIHASTGWRTMRIDCLGSQISFKVDSSTLLSLSDATRSQGQFGIGYQEQFLTNSNIRGTRADNFTAERLFSSGIAAWQHY